MMRSNRQGDPLGYLVPPGQLEPSRIVDACAEAMAQRRFEAGLGIPSVPTRYVVAMHTADRAWLLPGTEEDVARALERRAEDAGILMLGPIEVAFRCEPRLRQGHPRIWCGFRGDDLLVLAGPEAALQVFEHAGA